MLGYYLGFSQTDAPCLVFPLMMGGSFADRLKPSAADPSHLRRLGLPLNLSPLPWWTRLRVIREAVEALSYLHSSTAGGKCAVYHRDFKPENILLAADLKAFLADTGFAQVDHPDESARRSAEGFFLTMGYLCPSVVQGGEYSAVTDGYAVGITMLVALTNRSPLQVSMAVAQTRISAHARTLAAPDAAAHAVTAPRVYTLDVPSDARSAVSPLLSTRVRTSDLPRHRGGVRRRP